MENTGSFGLGQAGAADALQMAIQARQQGGNVPQLSQTSGAVGQQTLPPEVNSQTPQGIPAGMGTPAKMPDNEQVLITKALIQRANTLSTIEKAQAGVIKPKPQQAPIGGGWGR